MRYDEAACGPGVDEVADMFDELEVRMCLAGGEEDKIAVGLEIIHKQLRGRLCAWIRKSFPGLTADDLATTWSETLLGILEVARAGRFDGERPLFPWLCQILKARAIDHLRRQTTREEALVAVGRALRSTQVGQFWRALDEVERNEVMALIREAINLLPTQQQTVFRIFVAQYPETKNMNVLQREVARVTGRAQTLAGVKRALQEGRHKVRAFLMRKGYLPER